MRFEIQKIQRHIVKSQLPVPNSKLPPGRAATTTSFFFMQKIPLMHWLCHMLPFVTVPSSELCNLDFLERDIGSPHVRSFLQVNKWGCISKNKSGRGEDWQLWQHRDFMDFLQMHAEFYGCYNHASVIQTHCSIYRMLSLWAPICLIGLSHLILIPQQVLVLLLSSPVGRWNWLRDKVK